MVSLRAQGTQLQLFKQSLLHGYPRSQDLNDSLNQYLKIEKYNFSQPEGRQVFLQQSLMMFQRMLLD